MKALEQALAQALHGPAKMDNEGDFLRAAVMVPLLQTEEGWSLLFEVRASSLTWQPGEICFPGGKIDPEDITFADTAMRETCEELALCKEQIQLVGALDYIVTQIGVILYPYVGVVKEPTAIRPSDAEVAEVFTVPLSFFLDTEPLISEMEMATQPLPGFPYEWLEGYPRDWKKRRTYPVYFYRYGERVIWGLTAKVIDIFLRQCRTDLVGLLSAP